MEIEKLPWGKVASDMPLEWYASGQAAAVADSVLKYQTEIGGWVKNINFHKGMKPEEWNKVQKTGIGATFDNGATITEMRFLAKMYANRRDEKYRNAFLKGVDYIFMAQYDNGGWPQFYPARSSKPTDYSRCITYNDNAYVNIMNLLKDIYNDAESLRPLGLDEEIKEKARKSFDKGIKCILDTQIIVDGERTVWCAQHDEETLEPAKARAYELPSFSGAESVDIVLLLMSLPSPSDEVIASVNGAVKWFSDHKIPDMRYERYRDERGEKDSRLIPAPGTDVWARFYDLETGKPFFCDRDGIKRAALGEIGKERRGGYAWYTSAPSQLLAEYPAWLKTLAR